MIGQFVHGVLKEEANAVCRKEITCGVKRFFVPNEKVPWNVSWQDYDPPAFCAEYLKSADWADPDIKNENFKPKWNEEDGGIDRRSYDQDNTIEYKVINGYPQNPRGRTGMAGRGKLGRWGPNHAGDAIVTRWKQLNGTKQLDAETGLPILQFIAILRSDCKKWAIPGGFTNPKETSSAAVLRELFEEAVKIKTLPSEAQKSLKHFFKDGKQVYRGYVDDPRNTDNAWIETTAINFHDDSGDNTEKLELSARDDAAEVKWMDIVKEMKIYPPHYTIIEHLNKVHSI